MAGRRSPPPHGMPPTAKRVCSQNAGQLEAFTVLRSVEEQSHLQPAGSSKSAAPDSLTELPFRDVRVNDVQLSDDGGTMLASCADEATGVVLALRLSGFWAQTRMAKGTRLRVFCASAEWAAVDVSDESGFVLVEPDELVQCTAVASAVYCSRRTVLNARVRGGCDAGSRVMLLGTAVHALFQAALLHPSPRALDAHWLVAEFRRRFLADRATLQQLWALDLTPESLLRDVRSFLPHILRWARQILAGHLRSEPAVHEARVTAVRDIEESIWCTKFGLRGKIDVSLDVASAAADENVPDVAYKSVLPLELKTGKASRGADHVGQVLLYTLMLSALEGEPVDRGALLYLKEEAAHEVRPSHHALRGLLQLRNELAFHLQQLVDASAQPFQLPAPLNDARTCGACPQLLSCALWQRSLESTQPQSAAMSLLVPAAVGHLSATHLSYFGKWVRLVLLEWNDSKRSLPKASRIWHDAVSQNSDVVQRELRIDGCSLEDVGGDYLLRFVSADASSTLPASVFSPGEVVVVSSVSAGHYGVFLGPVIAVADGAVVVRVDKKPREALLQHRYRLDRYDGFTTFQLQLANLVRLMADSPSLDRLRQLLLDGRPAEFDSRLDSAAVASVKPLLQTLNSDQLRACLRVLMAKDYTLIHGLPGTGKTQTLAVVIRILVLLGKSVLLSAYTHSAVDNVLLRLIQLPGFNDGCVLRLGAPQQTHVGVRRLGLSAKLATLPDDAAFDAMRNVFESAAVVACTCLQAGNHALFGRRRFDVAVVDEATQAAQSVVVAPLLVADRFVLVGDPQQLAPLVKCRAARSDGMADCLFSALQRSSASKIAALGLQYRMNREIMRLSNELFYDGRLTCASEAVAAAALQATAAGDVGPPWFDRCLSTRLSDAVVFVNTDGCMERFQSERDGPGMLCNRGESGVVVSLCGRLLAKGVDARDLGVICVYHYQCGVVRRQLAETLGQAAAEVEVSTADQYQGRDKAVMLVSFVWTAVDEQSRSDLLAEPRRLNVLLTRAKHKLVLIGAKVHLERHEHMRRFFGALKDSQIVHFQQAE